MVQGTRFLAAMMACGLCKPAAVLHFLSEPACQTIGAAGPYITIDGFTLSKDCVRHVTGQNRDSLFIAYMHFATLVRLSLAQPQTGATAADRN